MKILFLISFMCLALSLLSALAAMTSPPGKSTDVWMVVYLLSLAGGLFGSILLALWMMFRFLTGA